MIKILLENVPFEQDIRELLMEFYPGEEYTYNEKTDASLTLTGIQDGRKYVFSLDGKEFTSDIDNDRFVTKCSLKRSVYTVLSELTGRVLPWGTLTGIRPTKLALEKLDEGAGRKEIESYFKKEFLITDEKLRLCMDTAVREKEVLNSHDADEGWSLYMGIPFCPTTCAYCSFTSYPIGIWKNRTDEYVDALLKEVKAVSAIMKNKKLRTVYMGGGTPTSLSSDQLSRILDTIHDVFDTSGLLELTVEAGRPDSITEDKLRAIKSRGTTRISINSQSMNQKTLDAIGRFHSVDIVKDRFNLARDIGFDNINTDLIIGLPGEGLREVEHTMDEIEKLHPEDVTIHSLAIKRAARLNYEKNNYSFSSGEEITEMMKLAADRCKAMGLSPYYMYRQKNMAGNYENVGLCAPGKESIYNILIMEERQTIVGCGAGTSTKIALGHGRGVLRLENVKDPAVYIERLDEMIEKKKVLEGI